VHELTLAAEICRIAERAVGPGRAERIREVTVDVGDDAGVEPSSLSFCLEALLDQSPFHHARPRLVREAGDVLRVRSVEVDDDDSDD
jgi:Zn finger protein HypA/HybF involved in hydrogenase expression